MEHNVYMVCNVYNACNVYTACNMYNVNITHDAYTVDRVVCTNQFRNRVRAVTLRQANFQLCYGLFLSLQFSKTYYISHSALSEMLPDAQDIFIDCKYGWYTHIYVHIYIYVYVYV